MLCMWRRKSDSLEPRISVWPTDAHIVGHNEYYFLNPPFSMTTQLQGPAPVHCDVFMCSYYYTPAQRSSGSSGVGGNWIHLVRLSVCLSVCLSVRPSVRPSVCRRHGFRSVTRVCLGSSLSNFMYMLFVAMASSQLIFTILDFSVSRLQL